MTPSLDQLAKTIRALSSEERETLEWLVSQDGEELMRRLDEVKRGDVQWITEDELFDE